MVGIVVHLIATADSHSVENIVEFHSQLCVNSLTQGKLLTNRQCFGAFKRIAEARIEWSGVPDPPSPGKLKLFYVEYRHALVIVIPVHIERTGHNIRAVERVEKWTAVYNDLHWRTTGVRVISGKRPATQQVLSLGTSQIRLACKYGALYRV